MSKVTRSDTKLYQFLEYAIIGERNELDEIKTRIMEREDVVYADVHPTREVIRIVADRNNYPGFNQFFNELQKISMGLTMMQFEETTAFFPKLPDGWQWVKLNG